VLARAREPCIALIGHQPGLGRLLASCLAGDAGSAAFELRKMGMALIAFPAAPRAGRGELIWLLPPRVLRAAR
jgi:phosphohistidine phosphatase SixA